jgi:hypothetical protein
MACAQWGTVAAAVGRTEELQPALSKAHNDRLTPKLNLG